MKKKFIFLEIVLLMTTLIILAPLRVSSQTYLGCEMAIISTSTNHGIMVALTDQSIDANWKEANDICSKLVLGGFDGWRLPTLVELKWIYSYKDKIGGFDKGGYWSSDELNTSAAWRHYFGDGGQNAYGKNTKYRVRAVRSF